MCEIYVGGVQVQELHDGAPVPHRDITIVPLISVFTSAIRSGLLHRSQQESHQTISKEDEVA